MIEQILKTVAVSIIAICLTVIMGLLVNHTPNITVGNLYISINLQVPVIDSENQE